MFSRTLRWSMLKVHLSIYQYQLCHGIDSPVSYNELYSSHDQPPMSKGLYAKRSWPYDWPKIGSQLSRRWVVVGRKVVAPFKLAMELEKPFAQNPALQTFLHLSRQTIQSEWKALLLRFVHLRQMQFHSMPWTTLGFSSQCEETRLLRAE